MNDKQTVVPDPLGQERTDAQDTAPQEIDLVAVKLTDVGRVRSHNEDYVDYFIPPDPQLRARKGVIYLVADGMGGHQAGEVASRGAVELVIKLYYADPSRDVGKSLVRAVQTANQQIHAQAQADPTKGGMGTTLVAAVILGRKVYVANVGDSRAYLINRRAISQITEDHSWVEEQLRAGLLTEEQAKRHPQRNLVTRALGSKPAVDVDLFEGEINRGDALLLCSDGLTGRVEDREMAAIVRDHPPQQAARLLVAAANERGGNDNITVLIVSADKKAALVAAPAAAPEKRAPARRSWLIPALVGGVAVIALALGALWATGILFGDKATATPTPALTAALDTPGPEATPGTDMGASPIATATQTLDVLDTSPTATLAPTLTGQPTLTATRPLSGRTATATATTRPTVPTPRLIRPATDSDLRGPVTFEWSYSATLAPDQAFQVLIWKEGELDHRGAAESQIQTRQTINLDAVPQVVDGGVGQYLWSVVVVRKGSDTRLSAEATPRTFTYLGPLGPSAPTATSTPTNTLPPTKIPVPIVPTISLSTNTPTPTNTPTDTPTPTATNTTEPDGGGGEEGD